MEPIPLGRSVREFLDAVLGPNPTTGSPGGGLTRGLVFFSDAASEERRVSCSVLESSGWTTEETSLVLQSVRRSPDG